MACHLVTCGISLTAKVKACSTLRTVSRHIYNSCNGKYALGSLWVVSSVTFSLWFIGNELQQVCSVDVGEVPKEIMLSANKALAAGSSGRAKNCAVAFRRTHISRDVAMRSTTKTNLNTHIVSDATNLIGHTPMVSSSKRSMSPKFVVHRRQELSCAGLSQQNMQYFFGENCGKT